MKQNAGEVRKLTLACVLIVATILCLPVITLYVFVYYIEPASKVKQVIKDCYSSNCNEIHIDFHIVHGLRKIPSSISGLKSLEKLTVRSSSLKNADSLGSLKNLHSLRMTGSHVRDFSFLTAMTGLEELYISNREFDDLSVIGSKGLKKLTIISSRLNGLLGIENLTQLETLTLGLVKVDDVSLLLEMKKLKRVYLWKVRGFSNEALENLRKSGIDVEWRTLM